MAKNSVKLLNFNKKKRNDSSDISNLSEDIESE